jgi:hypothetical protein
MLEPRALQETATITRSMLDIRRVMTLPSWGRLVVRATPAQMRTADWLIAALQNGADARHSMSETNESDLRLFALRQVDNANQFAVNVRKATKIQRLFVQSSPLLLAVGEVARAC